MIVIIDFGSQYTHLITSHLELSIGVNTKIIPHTRVDNYLQKNPAFLEDVNGVILSGGPNSVIESTVGCFWMEVLLSKNIPILGICYGLQFIVNYFGGKVINGDVGEFGKATLSSTVVSSESKLLHNVPIPSDVWMSHNDLAEELPLNFINCASTNVTKFAVIENHTIGGGVYAVQFHPEVKHTIGGKKILRNFLKSICKCKPRKKFTVQNNIVEITNDISSKVNEDNVLLALSGGVDSSVLCKLLHQTIGDKLMCVYVDNGLMRKGETEEIKKRFSYLENLIVLDESERFLTDLEGVIDPEKKRKIIGADFIKSFEDFWESLPERKQPKFLAQGTIYPDIIESCGLNATSKTIKSHHNVGGLPDTLSLELLEPFKYLFKNQIKEIGKYLGVNEETIGRHPFPGPGLGIRIVGEVKREYVTILREVDHIYISELKKRGLYNKISQAYAGFLPVRTVGVVGDNRRYGYTIVLRAVETQDFMTANVFQFPQYILSDISSIIIGKCPEISRVFYDVTSKPPSTIELE